ncbi:MAG TPA: hypothetical protein VFH95_01960 [Candidatus Kapabacteria bacterium]|nr:hypothetical protein [Candidatus Kapabacteria bacterium]
MAREALLFLILFAAGMLVMVFAGIVWMMAIWKKLALKMRKTTLRMRDNQSRRRFQNTG